MKQNNSLVFSLILASVTIAIKCGIISDFHEQRVKFMSILIKFRRFFGKNATLVQPICSDTLKTKKSLDFFLIDFIHNIHCSTTFSGLFSSAGQRNVDSFRR